MSNPDSLLNDFITNMSQNENAAAPDTVLTSKKTTRADFNQKVINVCNGLLNLETLTKEQVELLKSLLPYTKST